jgi:hypothetical protein
LQLLSLLPQLMAQLLSQLMAQLMAQPSKLLLLQQSLLSHLMTHPSLMTQQLMTQPKTMRVTISPRRRLRMTMNKARHKQ